MEPYPHPRHAAGPAADRTPARPHTVNLAKGAQAVINGALVTASTACTIEVGSGAFVLTDRSLWRDRPPLRNPREELYFSMIEASRHAGRFLEERFRMFTLLSQVVAQDADHDCQIECARCAHALITEDRDAAMRSAARLASERLACVPLCSPAPAPSLSPRQSASELGRGTRCASVD